jgi:hypothetical protein
MELNVPTRIRLESSDRNIWPDIEIGITVENSAIQIDFIKPQGLPEDECLVVVHSTRIDYYDGKLQILQYPYEKYDFTPEEVEEITTQLGEFYEEGSSQDEPDETATVVIAEDWTKYGAVDG